MAEQQLERSMLDGKDREQLHAIAGAMGIKGVTRLRKADLVGAILDGWGLLDGRSAATNDRRSRWRGRLGPCDVRACLREHGDRSDQFQRLRHVRHNGCRHGRDTA